MAVDSGTVLAPLATTDQAESILVVDDTASNRTLYSTLLTHAGYRVRSAQSGPEALLLVEEEEPSLMLLDYMMPEMNGAQVIRLLRARKAPVTFPIVILTASLNADDIEEALLAGAADYINKPVDSRILLTRVKSIIAAQQNQLKARAQPERDALRQELHEAQAVQRAQLPQVPASWSQWSATGAVAPSGQIAGDVFDLIIPSDGRGVAVLIDVSGHGTASALVAAETRTIFRELLSNRSLLDAVHLLNQRMTERDTGKYSCVAAIEVRDDAVSVVNAGLPPVVLWRSGTEAQSVSASGFPIGMFENSQYQSTSFRVQPGDWLVMMSDGMTEPFGAIDDVAGALVRLDLASDGRFRDLTSERLHARLSRLKPQAGNHTSELPDDATLVVLQWQGTDCITQERTIPATPVAIRECVDWAVSASPSQTDLDALRLGLTEALTNAVVHGALRISSEGRESDYDSYLAAIESKVSAPLEDLPRVQVVLTTTDRAFTVRLDWPGVACPVEKRAPTEPLASSAGFGMALIYSSFDTVEWDDSGRCLKLTTLRSR